MAFDCVLEIAVEISFYYLCCCKMKKFPSSQNPPNASADSQANKHPKQNHQLPKNLDQKAQKNPQTLIGKI